MNNIKVLNETVGKCPECGGDMLEQSLGVSFCQTTGEYWDEGEPIFETVHLSNGYLVKCLNPDCGYMDGEPPTY